MKISRGKIELRISSLNHGKIIEKFKKEGITLYNCKREYKRLSCRISLEEKNRVIALLEKNNLDFSFGKTYGLLSIVQYFFSRIGLWVGILLLVAICVLYSNTYFKIEIVGVEGDLYSKLGKVVKEDVKSIAFKNQVNLEELTTKMESIEGISKVTAYFLGSKLLIDCLPSLDYPYDVEKNRAPIISNYDCIISKISLESGYCLVNVGDTVKKGDVLISSTFSGEEEKPIEDTIGKVYGRCWLTKKYLIYPQEVVTQRTGRVFRSRSWYIGDTLVFSGVKCRYSTFEKESKRYSIQGVLPITIIENTYYEISSYTQSVDMDSKEEEVVNIALMEFQNSFGEGITPVRWWKISKPLDKIREISIYYEIEREVSLKELLTEKNA